MLQLHTPEEFPALLGASEGRVRGHGSGEVPAKMGEQMVLIPVFYVSTVPRKTVKGPRVLRLFLEPEPQNFSTFHIGQPKAELLAFFHPRDIHNARE
ncbi:MAG: hypothetical protein A2038_11945 [Deltaproteobacteria bacterium GWA2_57_13]|nr:MAG: hypothetical protein A2038_11945 [Deltaproteobacteria bacterium GWA2_57_13]OGQ80250.1 MAG: hypothetical protein A3G40_13675 [Deltaproteobacteria bacterium RIFCSPLOWO2_12_FULL_57_22]